MKKGTQGICLIMWNVYENLFMGGSSGLERKKGLNLDTNVKISKLTKNQYKNFIFKPQNKNHEKISNWNIHSSQVKH